MISTIERSKVQAWLNRFNQRVQHRSNLFHVLSDPTRVKILLLLKKYHDALCVSDVAAILHVSISAVSHQMSFMERSGLVRSVKKGKAVCYYLTVASETVVSHFLTSGRR